MNVKVWFLLVLLIVSILSVASVAPVSSSHTPSSTDDGLFETFGPRPSQLLINIYTDYTAELAAFKNKEFDIMDWSLEPIDYQWFESNDPTHSQYASALYTEFGIFEYDLNNAAMPLSIGEFRQALSHVVDKDYFINTYLSSSGTKLDSPIGSLPGWYDQGLTDLYNLAPRTTETPLPDDWADWQAAYDLFNTALGMPIVDPEDASYYTWAWTTPPPLNVANGTFPPVANNHLLFFVRSDSGPRLEQGNFLKTALEVALPAILQAHGLPRARIHVDQYNVPRSVTSVQVMLYYRYHIYTGGFGMNRDPDYLTSFMEPFWGRNLWGYVNPWYDDQVNAMRLASKIGISTNPGDAKYHAYQAQDILMSDAVFIPMWSFAGYKPYLSNWRDVVNQAGFGANSWWTLLNAHKVGSEGGDVVRYGWQGDVLSLNVVSAQWMWDWDVLSKVYDSLIAFNPYDVSQDLPYIAKNWTIGTWDGSKYPITFNLRVDVWWQDVPLKDRSGITFDGSHSIDGPFINMPLTPIDVAFSLMYIRDNLDSWNGYLAGPVDHVAVNMDLWGSLWSSSKPGWYTADTSYGIPWQSNFVQNDPTLDSESITIYFNQPMGWIGLHWVGAIPIMPYHVWRYITQADSFSVDTIGNDIIYGTGPYIYLTRTPGVSLTMIPYVSGESYRGITLGQGYFYQPIRPPMTEADHEILYYSYPQLTYVTFENALTNVAPFDVNNVSWYFDFRIIGIANNGKIVFDTGRQNTAASSIAIAAGATVTLGPTTVYVFTAADNYALGRASQIIISDSTHWSYSAFGGAVTFNGVYGETDKWANIVVGQIPALDGFVSELYKLWITSDINHDGVNGIQDAAMVGLNWQKTSPPTPENVDINGDGIINIVDASQVGRNWQRGANGDVWVFFASY